MTIDYAPPWASGSDDNKHPPRDPAHYGGFCRAAATRYAPLGVRHWEIWNEPNIASFWKPAPDPAACVALLAACSTAIRGVDPQAVVVTGGTSPARDDPTHVHPVTWLRALYALGARRYFDAVAHHPYTWPELPGGRSSWNPWFQMDGAATSLRTVMTANGDAAKQIWITETGTPTNLMSEGWQALMVTAAARHWRAVP